MKFVERRPYTDPEAAARKLLEIANAFEPIQDGRIYIEAINGPMLYQHKATPAEYKAGLDLAIERGLELHESGTFVWFTQSGRDLLARGCSRIDTRLPRSPLPKRLPHQKAPGSALSEFGVFRDRKRDALQTMRRHILGL